MPETPAYWKVFCNTDKILQQWKLSEDQLLLGAHHMSQIRSLCDGGFHSCRTVGFTPLLNNSIQQASRYAKIWIKAVTQADR